MTSQTVKSCKTTCGVLLLLLTFLFTATVVSTSYAQAPVGDYGDAPEPGFPSLYASGGPCHLDTTQEWLGPGPVSTTTVENDSLQIDSDTNDQIAWWSRQVDDFNIPRTWFGTTVTYNTAISSPGDPRFLNVLIDLDTSGTWDGGDEWPIRNHRIPFESLPPDVCSLYVALRAPDSIEPNSIIGNYTRATLSDSPVPDGSGAWGVFARGETEDFGIPAVPPLPPQKVQDIVVRRTLQFQKNEPEVVCPHSFIGVLTPLCEFGFGNPYTLKLYVPNDPCLSSIRLKQESLGGCPRCPDLADISHLLSPNGKIAVQGFVGPLRPPPFRPNLLPGFGIGLGKWNTFESRWCFAEVGEDGGAHDHIRVTAEMIFDPDGEHIYMSDWIHALVVTGPGVVSQISDWIDGDPANSYWTTPGNWDPCKIPTGNDAVYITSGLPEANQPVILPGTNAEAWHLSVGGLAGTDSLTIEGGTLTLGHGAKIGDYWQGCTGSLYLNPGGQLTCTDGHLWIGYRCKGHLYMNGGIIDIPNGSVAIGVDSNDVYGQGYVHLDGGCIITHDFTMRQWNGGGPVNIAYMDITGGTLIVNGNITSTIQDYFDNGWITAYGIGSQEDANIVSDPRAELVVGYDERNAEKTTVTAFKPANNGEPYKLYPPQYAVGVAPMVTLSWTPGDYVGTGGTPGSQTGNGHHVFIGTLEDQSGNMEGWNLQYPVGTQYGHIVGAQDAGFFDIATDYPAGVLELDTEYVWTVIESNDLNAPSGDWWWKAPIHYFRTIGGAASNPFPADGATVGIKVGGAALEVELSWNLGYHVASEDGHVVYFGTDFNDVNTATGGTPQTPASYTATGLELGETYYWRVDEVNTAGPDPCIWPGDVRSFTVGDYRVVDEFNYANFDYMNEFWKINAFDMDYTLPCSTYGGGAWIDLDHGAMSYTYDNNGTGSGEDYFSEVRYEFPAPVDFTDGDSETTLRALALDYTGNAGNAADPNYDRMYVGLESANGNMAIVSNPDPDAQKKSGNWNIDLDEFIDAGVDVQNIVYLYLGFGIQCNPNPGNPGGEGTVTFDNIRVYPPRCVGLPGYRQLGDLDGDCTVNITDMKLLSNAWLVTDRLTGVPVAVADDDPCMMARWEFEGDYLNDPNGRMGSAADGTPYGELDIMPDETRPESLPGNHVVYFDQDLDTFDGNDYVMCGTWGQDGNFLGKSLTLMVWAKQTQELDWWADMISKGESAEKLEFGIVPFLERRVLFTGSGVVACPATELDFDTWYHIAGTYEKLPDVNGGISRLYIDGRLAQETDGNEIAYVHSVDPTYDPNWCIGAQDFEGSKYDLPTPFRRRIDRVYYGYLDDVRIYDRQLSEEEIMWLAGKRAPSKNYYAILPPASYADISSPEPKGQKTVNFKDMAKLAQEWLQSADWPVIP